MAEQNTTLDWKKLLDPDHVPLIADYKQPPTESEVSPAFAGAGFGAVLAVPAFLLMVARFLPGSFSDTALIFCALAAPAIGGVIGAILGYTGAAVWQRYWPEKTYENLPE